MTNDSPDRLDDSDVSPDDGPDYRLLLDDIGSINSEMRELVSGLREGGPAVDVPAIEAHVRGELEEEASALTASQIVTWLDWWVTYWRVSNEYEQQRGGDRPGRGP